MTTPILRIELALRGKIDFIKKTNPFGSSEEDEEARKLAEQRPDPDLAARQMLAYLKRMQGSNARHARKPKTKK